jgi:hypothetical protein
MLQLRSMTHSPKFKVYISHTSNQIETCQASSLHFYHLITLLSSFPPPNNTHQRHYGSMGKGSKSQGEDATAKESKCKCATIIRNQDKSPIQEIEIMTEWTGHFYIIAIPRETACNITSINILHAKEEHPNWVSINTHCSPAQTSRKGKEIFRNSLFY